MTVGKHITLLLVVGSLVAVGPLVPIGLLAGCRAEPFRQTVVVGPADGEILPRGDAGSGGDGTTAGLALARVSPAHGPFLGGTEVRLEGHGFAPGVTVTIGGKTVPPTQIAVLSPVALLVVTPAGEVGPADVVVTSGGQTVTLPASFHYDALYLDPASGPTVGGTLVTLQGRGTHFQPGITLTLGGAALLEVKVISDTQLTARTPPGPAGPAALSYSEEGKTQLLLPDAFMYYSSANPRTGGLGGGPIQGSLTITVLDWLTREPISGATVIVQRGRELQLVGTTDAQGGVIFRGEQLVGPVTATASHEGFETSSFVDFDARDLTIFLTPFVDPEPGPLIPGPAAGTVEGYVLFGGTTGVGSSSWKLVPEPKAGQNKRVYVFATVPSITWGPPSPVSSATIDSTDDGTTAWPYTLVGYDGALAVYAVAGLYNSANASFEPYALGVKRGIVVGPGETAHADVWVNIPLSEKLTLELKDAPAELSRFTATLGIDLGADGVMLLEPWEASGDTLFQTHAFTRLPTFNNAGLIDATYTVNLLLESTAPGRAAMTQAVERAIPPTSKSVVIDRLVGIPVQVKPAVGEPLQGNTLAWTQHGAPHNLAVTQLQQSDGTPIWRIFSPGPTTMVKLPDPASLGLSRWPAGPVRWLQWLAHLPSFSYDSFTYSHLSSKYWDRWSFDELGFMVP